MTERLLTANGFLCECVESYNAHAGKSSDFLGFADYIAVKPYPDGYTQPIAIQVTTASNGAARLKKILSSIDAVIWHKAKGSIWLITWKEVDRTWQPSVKRIFSSQFPTKTVEKAFDYWRLKKECAYRDIQEHHIKTEFLNLVSF